MEDNLTIKPYLLLMVPLGDKNNSGDFFFFSFLDRRVWQKAYFSSRSRKYTFFVMYNNFIWFGLPVGSFFRFFYTKYEGSCKARR